MNKEILNATNDIINIIESSDEYRKYISIKEKMSNNDEINSLIKDIKVLQKKAVKEQAHGNSTKEIDEEISNKINELEQYPIYLDYKYLQEDLNNYIKIVKNRIEKYLIALTN